MLIKGVICCIISYGIVLVLMPYFIDFMKRLSFNQSVSEYSLEEYKEKAKTPVMGGVLFILTPILVTIVSNVSCLKDMDVLVIFMTFLGYGLIGFIDDFLIVVKKNNDGLKAWQKFGLQVLLAVVFYLIYRNKAALEISIPFTSHVIYLGAGYGLLILLMFAGSSNAVNLTDGMDGLAAGCEVFTLIPFLCFSYLQGRESIVVFIFSLIGALFGYLHYNVKPARIFMGDTGALALGAVLAALAMVLKKEIALIVIAGVFVVETLCVIIQQVSVRTRHKKVFIYTPIHYAFVIKGKGEKETVRMFWIASCIFSLIGLWIGLH